MKVVISPARNVLGSVRVPGDKSIAHRYAMLGALAKGTTRIADFPASRDCLATLECLRALGVTVSEVEPGVVEIEGRGGDLRAPQAPLDCSNSGTTMRLLAGVLAAQAFDAELRGDESLSRRPMMRVVEPLRAMGATVECGDGGRAPLRIRGGKLKGITHEVSPPSAQVKTALLFAGLRASDETKILEAVRTRDHGELALLAFGAEVARARNGVTLSPGGELSGIGATLPGDISSAAFFLGAAAMYAESSLVVEGVGMNPTRSAILDVLGGMGTRIGIISLEERHGELVGSVKIDSGALRGARIAAARSAQLIDELPLLAAIAPHTRDGIEIRDARELRVKESDRIGAVAAGLRTLGAEVEEFEDGLRVPGGQRLRGGEVESCGDHRVAMAMAVTALRAEGPVTIHGAECVEASFPGFFELLERVVER